MVIVVYVVEYMGFGEDVYSGLAVKKGVGYRYGLVGFVIIFSASAILDENGLV